MSKKQTKPTQSSTNITGCTFNGVHWDGKALEAVNSVARALENMTHLFKAQSISIDALLRIEAPNGAKRPEA